MSSIKQTKRTFRDKWQNNKHFFFAETLTEGSEIFKWILNRNGFKDGDDLKKFLKTKRRVLDAGCGNGRVTALLRNYSSPSKTEIVGVDLVAADIARKNLSQYKNVIFFTKDILGDLSDLGEFDFIYCQEVLHHIANPQLAFSNLCQLLLPKGEIAIYVYKRKAPAREFVDDYIREKISKLPYKKALAVCRQIADLGKSLSEASIKIRIPAVDILEIKEGEYDLQRFIYHFFMKCFWNKKSSIHDNAIINYDWYHPQLCSKHTLEEARRWFAKAKLKIVHEFVDFYGITVRGKSN